LAGGEREGERVGLYRVKERRLKPHRGHYASTA
jgi:hypothetical protein